MIAPSSEKPASRTGWRRKLLRAAVAAAILVPSLYGFGTKFVEFLALYRGDVEGVFAVSPVINYLLASVGFLLLFAWAVTQGMFRDIEGPKYTMLETERRLDALAAARGGWPPGRWPPDQPGDGDANGDRDRGGDGPGGAPPAAGPQPGSRAAHRRAAEPVAAD